MAGVTGALSGAAGIHDLPSAGTVAVLLVAALVAGYLDAVVGGGGLVQLPMLLLMLPTAVPIQILATNKLSSICGTTVSAVTYGRKVRPEARTALPLALLALAGAVGGALTAGLISTEAFRLIVLVALVVVASVTFLRPALGIESTPRFHGHRHVLAAGVSGLAIGWYDGAIGPGTGTFLVFTLVGLLGMDFLRASAAAKIGNAATNLAALLVFAPQGAPLWRLGLLMGACNLVGGFLGARTAIARGSAFVRVLFLVVATALIVRLGVQVAESF
ncbi:MAG: sulfite exporter TauE/SafE family protein [Actinomycetales bacterium]